MIPSPPRLAFVDRDGTLFDTCSANIASFDCAFKEIVGEIPAAVHALVRQGTDAESIEAAVGLAPEVFSRVLTRKRSLFSEMLDMTLVNLELLHELRACFSGIVLVTNASRQSTGSLLDHWRMRHVFAAVITREDVVAGKPAPDPYLHALAKSRIGPESAVVFEDSAAGLLSGQLAGLETRRVDHFCRLSCDHSA